MYASTRFWKSARTSASGFAFCSAAFSFVAVETVGAGGLGAAVCAGAVAGLSAHAKPTTTIKRMTFIGPSDHDRPLLSRYMPEKPQTEERDRGERMGYPQASILPK